MNFRPDNPLDDKEDEFVHRSFVTKPAGFGAFGRFFGFCFVFILVGAGFWFNANRQISNIIDEKLAQIDTTASLSEEDTKELLAFKKKFQEVHGIILDIKIAERFDDSFLEKIRQSSVPSLCISIALNQKKGNDAVIVASPLVEAAMGSPFLLEINRDLQEAVQQEHWKAGLNTVLNRIHDKCASFSKSTPVQTQEERDSLQDKSLGLTIE